MNRGAAARANRSVSAPLGFPVAVPTPAMERGERARAESNESNGAGFGNEIGLNLHGIEVPPVTVGAVLLARLEFNVESVQRGEIDQLRAGALQFTAVEAGEGDEGRIARSGDLLEQQEHSRIQIVVQRSAVRLASG